MELSVYPVYCAHCKERKCNKYPLWRVKTGITAVTSAAETTSHGVLRRVESWNSSELGWCPSRSFPLLCEVFLDEWKRDALPDRKIFHAHRASPPIFIHPFLPDHSYLMRVSVYLPLPLFTLELPRLDQPRPTPVLLPARPPPQTIPRRN